MMGGPGYFTLRHSKDSYYELKRERNRLIREIRRYEDGDITDEERMRKPSPIVKYRFNHLYLSEACRMMFETDRNGERSETKMLYEEILKFIEEHREEFEEWLRRQ